MSAEFNWWLLIVGLIAGGVLTWLVLADSTRRDREISDEELAAEAAWIARTLGHQAVDGEVVRGVLQAHRRYLGFPPPDALVDPDELASEGGRPAADDPSAVPTIDAVAAPAGEPPAAADEPVAPADEPPSSKPPGPGAGS